MRKFDNRYVVQCFYGPKDGFGSCNWVTEYGGHCRGGWANNPHRDHSNGGWCSQCVENLHANI